MSNMTGGYPPNWGVPGQPGYPQQPQQQPAQPPQAVPGGWGQPMPGPAPGMFPGGPAPGMAPGYPPGAPVAGPPAMYGVDEAALLGQYKQTKEDLANQGKGIFLNIPGPNGQPKWTGVPKGFENSALVWICGPWTQGAPVFVTQITHFYKSHSHPKGTSIGCPGAERCKVCQAGVLAAASNDSGMQERAKFTSQKINYLYNVIWLENPQAHVFENNTLRPLILQAGKKLHTKIGDLFVEAKGIMNLIDYRSGRPVRIIKRKTGTEDQNVEWDAVVSFNAQPLDPQFYPVAANLNDLTKFLKFPTEEEQLKVISELRLPMPGTIPGMVGMPAPSAWSPGHNPPHMPGGVAPPGYGGPPAGFAPTPSPAFGPPQPQGFAPPQPQQPAAATPPYWPAQAQTPPQFQEGHPQMGQPQQPQAAPPPQFGFPGMSGPPQPVGGTPVPSLVPPPVSSAPGAMAPPAQPGQGGQIQPGQPMGPGQGAPAPSVAPPGGSLTPVLTLPLPAGTTLPDGRERCFGKHNEADRWCQGCPGWVKQQCIPASGGGSATTAQAPQGDNLDALQQQLTGQAAAPAPVPGMTPQA